MNINLRNEILYISLLLLFSQSFGAAVSFDLSKTNGALQARHLAGTCLPIWNSQNIYKQIKKGLMQSNYRLFRFPNGSLSNGYHWNGKGSYNSDSIWVCDSEAFAPGFMSMTLFRGTSVSNWGHEQPSKITDGDTSTFWRSDELISGSFPYFYCELPQSTLIDSIVIVWGERYAADFTIDFFSLAACPYPGPFGYQDDEWQSQKQITDNQQDLFSTGLPGNKSTRYVRVLVKKFKGQEKSVEVKEMYLYSQGTQITKNTNKYTGGSPDDQTMAVAMPTHIGNTVRPGTDSYTTGATAWHFEAFMDYIRSMPDTSVPVICVNYGTGTPDEAAAWVHYANGVKNYNIRFWQIGNEMDGAWEEGGPVTARMYSEKFLLFAKAMKKADSTIKIFGPLQSNAEFYAKNSGLYDGKSWTNVFIESIGKEEKADNKKYCDGIDFHSYPYWAYSPNAAELLLKTDFVYQQTDSLRKWMDSSLISPESMYVMMSEFNSMAMQSDLLQKSLNGIFVANMYAGLAEKFGDRAMSVFWDSYEEGGIGSNGTFGSMSLFDNLDAWRWSSLGKPPAAAYWALFLAQNIWIDPKKENAVVPALSKSSQAIRAYGIKTPVDFRALFFNVSAKPETLSCSLSTNTYTRADVFQWGEVQFKWIGSAKQAFAFPSCGPTSISLSTNDCGGIVIPALSMCVVRYHEPDSNVNPPKFLHLWAYPTTGVSGVLPVCGSVSGGTNVVVGIDYAIDSAKTFPRSLRSLDSSFDGPCESYFDSLSIKGLFAGQHKLYLQARTASGSIAIDSFAFSVSQPPVRCSGFANNNGWRILEKKSGNRIMLTFDSPLPADDNVPIAARVISSNGACVKELACQRKGGIVIEWAGDGVKNKNAAPGVYYLVVSSEGKVIYRTAMVISK